MCAGLGLLLGAASVAQTQVWATSYGGMCGTPRYSAEAGMWELTVIAVPVFVCWLVSGFRHRDLLCRRLIMVAGLTCWAFGMAFIHLPR